MVQLQSGRLPPVEGDDSQIPEPDTDGDELEGRGAVFREFVVADGYAPELFDLVEEALDQMDTSGKSLKRAFFWKFSCYITD